MRPAARTIAAFALLLVHGCARQPAPPPGMVRVPGGTLPLGSADSPTSTAVVQPFLLDEHEVTNAQFAAFVAATGHVSDAERLGDAVVFVRGPAAADGARGGGWKLVPGATWRHPDGPGSDLAGRDTHPVVHVSLHDARAYAQWAQKRLPTEIEWEWAARGGLVGAPFVWGQEHQPTPLPANLWQGRFPTSDAGADGHFATAPTKSYAPNGYGLFDMAGNVWEWVDTPRFTGPAAALHTPLHPDEEPGLNGQIRGGSFLCAVDWCEGYRPDARQWKHPNECSNNVGFRCAR
ncbi:MAG: SUMF1/EgtB/PvdO family nonheme iron enzyme [Planctomycetaceae bacterium]|nr:SUMF1/EgtB/PvdO family nonheme iron enzyme [Planctomycetaceae bacterium]